MMDNKLSPDNSFTQSEALRLQALRLRTMAEDLERMATRLENQGDSGYVLIHKYPKI